jgi:hypothetical protein
MRPLVFDDIIGTVEADAGDLRMPAARPDELLLTET